MLFRSKHIARASCNYLLANPCIDSLTAYRNHALLLDSDKPLHNRSISMWAYYTDCMPNASIEYVEKLLRSDAFWAQQLHLLQRYLYPLDVASLPDFCTLVDSCNLNQYMKETYRIIKPSFHNKSWQPYAVSDISRDSYEHASEVLSVDLGYFCEIQNSPSYWRPTLS